jgi:hypothetical protein
MNLSNPAFYSADSGGNRVGRGVRRPGRVLGSNRKATINLGAGLLALSKRRVPRRRCGTRPLQGVASADGACSPSARPSHPDRRLMRQVCMGMPWTDSIPSNPAAVAVLVAADVRRRIGWGAGFRWISILASSVVAGAATATRLFTKGGPATTFPLWLAGPAKMTDAALGFRPVAAPAVTSVPPGILAVAAGFILRFVGTAAALTKPRWFKTGKSS